ncbi:MAG: alpha/beta hydrolase-fold protein [Candidatus Aminicenantales bacterium]
MVTRRSRYVLFLMLPAAVILLSNAWPSTGVPPFRFEISFPESVQREPLDGRILLLISKDFRNEPRFTTVNWRSPQPYFGIDVEGLGPGQPAVIESTTLGFPLESIDLIPAGEYNVQAVFHVYATFHRSDGHIVKMPMDQWEGQQWNTSPGNLFSLPAKMKIDPAAGETIRLALTERIPPIAPPEDTPYIKHVKIRSELVSRFWGTDMYIGAVVLLPEGFESHPEARYPVAYLQSHFTPTMRGFVEKPENSFFKEWTSPDFPRFLLVTPQDPNPFYDDSYAVNSANVGPYGDALMQELIPFVERKFRAIGQPWARTVFGGSTGGWRAFALQVFHPDEFNGAWVFCPDPVDFRYFQLVNIYRDENAYYANFAWKKEPSRPWMRNVDDQVLATQEQASIFELVLGTKGRSGQQLDIFQAVFGPVGSDGYPRLLYDKRTGVIDKEVVAYWRENYDLSHIIERDWASLGPRLNGKLHIYVGDTDTFFLEEATMLLEKFLRKAANPIFEGTTEYGKRAPHCWSGCAPGRNPTLCYLPAMAENILKTAPPDADLESWRY